MSFPLDLGFVKRGQELLFRYTHVIGHLSYDVLLGGDNLVSLQIINKFIVLSWNTKSLFKVFNLIFLLFQHLFETFLDIFVTFKLEGDKVLVLDELLSLLSVELDILL